MRFVISGESVVLKNGEHNTVEILLLVNLIAAVEATENKTDMIHVVLIDNKTNFRFLNVVLKG